MAFKGKLGIFILISLGFLIIYFILRYILGRLVDKRITNYQNDLISKHFTEVENIYKQMRGWRHDYHNHIQVMKAYLKLGKYDHMDLYLNDLNEDLTKIDTMIKTGNIMVDSILNSKLSLAEEKGINVKAKAQVPKELEVSDVDLCVIIGNLLDNAIEASEKLENQDDRFIRVYIREMKGQLYISITNSLAGQLKKSGFDYLTTKVGLNHGFGLKRIDSTVKKYDGFINRQNEEGVFATEIILPI